MPDAMGRLSAEEIREPKVVITMTDDAWVRQPEWLHKEMRPFFNQWTGKYEVPAYCYREWLLRLEDGAK